MYAFSDPFVQGHEVQQYPRTPSAARVAGHVLSAQTSSHRAPFTCDGQYRAEACFQYEDLVMSMKLKTLLTAQPRKMEAGVSTHRVANQLVRFGDYSSGTLEINMLQVYSKKKCHDLEMYQPARACQLVGFLSVAARLPLPCE
jgi:hypothetical protein